MTSASIITPNVSCSCVCLYSWFKIIFGLTSFLSSMHMRMPCLSDSSLRSVIPSTFLSRTRSAIFSISLALFTIKGSSVTTIRFLPLFIGSILDIARTLILPFPVRYASLMPAVPKILPPVGKSGPFTIAINSSIFVERSFSTSLSIIFTTALITSRRLCGGIFVAMPTAMPVVPFTNRFG